MHENIKSAGFIVHDNNQVIFGLGATSDEAWADFLREMGDANVIVLAKGEERPENRDYVREEGYPIRAATAALMQLVAERGGSVAWSVARGIACTVAENEEG